MKCITSWLILCGTLLLLMLPSSDATPDCKLLRADYQGIYTPLLIDSAGNFLRPSQKEAHATGSGYHGYYTVTHGTIIKAVCPGDSNGFIDLPTGTPSVIELECDGRVKDELKLIYNETHYDLASLACFDKPKTEVTLVDPQDVSGAPCVGYNKYTIGYEYGTSPVSKITVIDFCFDFLKKNTLYAKYTLKGNALQFKAPSVSASNKKDSLYPSIGVDGCYAQSKQNILMNGLMPDNCCCLCSMQDTYIDADNIWQRNHVIDAGDFVTAPEMLSIYYYAVILPIWKKFSLSNMQAFSYYLRAKAELDGADFEVTTGSHNIAKVINECYTSNDIYIGNGCGEGNVIPIPEVVWTVMYNDDLDEGIAFVIHNTKQFVTTPPNKICAPTVLASTISWLNGRPDEEWADVTKGFCYLCKISDLHNAVSHAPNHPNAGILGLTVS